MPLQHVGLNLTQGIEGVAQSPPRPGGLGVLPGSTQIMPSNSMHTPNPVPEEDGLWIDAASRWDTTMRQFLTPAGIAPDVLLPSLLQARLRRVRNKADKAARHSAKPHLRALVDVLDDDEILKDLLQSYRNALVKA